MQQQLGAGGAARRRGVVQAVIQAYTYVGVWMSISISVILFNKVCARVCMRGA